MSHRRPHTEPNDCWWAYTYIPRRYKRFLSPEQPQERVWGPKYLGEPQTVYVYIHALREKIEEDPQRPRRILTVRGIGYQLAPQGAAPHA
ncbi:MAG TPA: helix-turn-helix domain-containing protein [Caldilineaceae bacterium]|nr:helix-turn-helix domain-containing protein [Caldilineaceae bacterium]